MTGEVISLGVVSSLGVGRSIAEAWRFQAEEHAVLEEETGRSLTKRSKSWRLNEPGMSSYRLGAGFVSRRQAFWGLSDIWQEGVDVYVSAPYGPTLIDPFGVLPSASTVKIRKRLQNELDGESRIGCAGFAHFARQAARPVCVLMRSAGRRPEAAAKGRDLPVGDNLGTSVRRP